MNFAEWNNLKILKHRRDYLEKWSLRKRFPKTLEWKSSKRWNKVRIIAENAKHVENLIKKKERDIRAVLHWQKAYKIISCIRG